MSNFISLESLQIAKPCRADWNKMTGDEQSRFCASCSKNVYNLSAMTRAEAERLIQEKEGHLCVQLHRRADGMVITSDCPVGAASLDKIPFPWKAVVVSVVASLVGIMGLSAQPTMGAPSPPRVSPKPTPAVQYPMLLGEVLPPPSKPRHQSNRKVKGRTLHQKNLKVQRSKKVTRHLSSSR